MEHDREQGCGTEAFVMRCHEPGCTGSYEDGYCNVCGSPEPRTADPVATPWGAARPAAARQGESAEQPQVAGGATATGGETPVNAEQQAVAVPGLAARAAAAVGRRLTAAAAARLAPGRAQQGGATPRAAMGRRRVARRGSGSRLGMGLTQVPPVPPVDPASVVLRDPVVPEERRVCPSCGAKVGRARGEAGGREEGFCPQCRAPYSFNPKLAEGDLVAGQYEVAGALAHGGLGWIYLARDRNVSGRWVVLKGLLNTGDEDAVSAAMAEQQFLAQVEHPLIVEIYNVVRHEGDAYTVMEYVGGVSLKQLLKNRMAVRGAYDPFPVDQALAYVLEILPAFQYLHDIGLLYCDFKPDNLIQVGDGVKLIDLGGMRRIDDLESPIYGTVGFQAPEIADAGPSIASDVYTIGRTLAVLTFEFRGYQSQYADSLPPVDAVPAFREHDPFYRLVAKCCAPDPDDRFQSVEELRTQMTGVLRQVVGPRGGVATQTAHSTSFEPPAVTGDTLRWWELPALRRDDHDPMLDWLSSVQHLPPQERYGALAKAPEITAEVLIAQAEAALQAGEGGLAQRAARSLMAQDPWDWRAAWMLGLEALARGDGPAATRSFAAVRDQVPGELAPRLALGAAAEVSGYADAAATEYLTVVRTDAAYVAAGALGLARVRGAQGDLDGAIEALAAVPATSRAHPQALGLRAAHLLRRGSLPDLEAAYAAALASTPDERRRADLASQIHEQALRQVLARGPQPSVSVGGVPATEIHLRTALERDYRLLASLTPDADDRAALVDRSHAVRPWSLT